jgi:hypothetical protein
MAEEAIAAETTETAEETPEPKKKGRQKLKKDLTDHPLVKITVLEGNQGEMEFNFMELPDDIQEKFGPFGLGHKLGDAAAGKSDTEAEEAITRVWEGLMAGDWSVRAPAAPKVSLKAVVDNFDNLTSEEQDKAKEILKGLGMKIPGITEEVEG